MRFRVVPDEKCLRGMRFDYVVETPIAGPAVSDMAAALATVFEPQAVTGRERWTATRTVHRVIIQFRVEWRLGERDDRVSAIYRTCCPTGDREELTARFERWLSQFDAA